MDMDYKKSIGNIADYIAQCTFVEFPRLNLIAGIISEDEYRNFVTSLFLLPEDLTEEVIINIREMKGSPERIKMAYAVILRSVITFEEMLELSPNLSKIMDEINGKGISDNVKKYLRYMKETIAPAKYGEFEKNLGDS